MGYDERKDTFDDEFEVVDLDEDAGEPRRWWRGLVQGEHLSRWSRLALLGLSALVLLVVGWLLWPNLVLLAQSALPRPAAQTKVVGMDVTPVADVGHGSVVATFSLGDMVIARINVPFKGSESRIVAVRRESGNVAWESQPTIMNMGVEDGKLWVQENDHSLNGISERDGSLVWHTVLPQDAQPEATISGLLLAMDSSQRWSAYQVADGSLQWHYNGGGVIQAVDRGQGVLYFEHVQSGKGLLLTGVRMSDGKVVWQSTRDVKELPIHVVAANGVVYSLGSDAVLTAVRVRDNRELWRRSLPHTDLLEEVADGKLYIVSSQDGTLTAIDTMTGAQQWRYDVDGTPVVVAVQSQVIYLKTDQSLMALNSRTGNLQWHYETHMTLSDVQIQDGRIYAISDQQGSVMVLDIRDGSLQWQYMIGTGAVPSWQPQGYVAQIEQGVIYLVLNHNTSLSALSVLDKETLWQTSLTTTG
ncbi:hypothetical protein KDH_57850 [Dictyobacter sp. S3.2.2.5]|uniref:Pyrrolo-quinoline quinone repeat domain-containing protein n=1 Tax=Dictyobacter halimunensis TaxID=3026934 RepID=A0ABQ6G1H0_9CHLR|nr:hypothetical protein KDH_57850 [Dictyobacter sp. S3.2.2.5]